MRELHKQWKGLLVRGIIAILFGFLAIFSPGLGLQLLVLLFGAFALVDGVVAFFVGLSSKSWAFILEGIVGVLVGLYVFFYTVDAIVVFLLLIAIWAFVTGIIEIIAAIELRKYVANEIWLVCVGIISVLFGVLVFVNPVVSAVAIAFVIGVYAVLFGVFLVALSFRVKDYSPSKSSRRR